MTFWTPNINIFRDPRWGRGQETFGEDPYLTSEIGIEFVKGIQGDDPNYMLAMACAKHYAVHSGPELDRHRFDARTSDRDLYETYLPQFERVGARGQSRRRDGRLQLGRMVFQLARSAFLLDDLLRKQWGFEGYVVSDCDAIRDIWAPAAASLREHRRGSRCGRGESRLQSLLRRGLQCPGARRAKGTDHGEGN